MKKIIHFTKYFSLKLKTSNSSFAATFLAYHLILSFIPLLVFLLQMLSFVAPGFDQLILKTLNTLPKDIQQVFSTVVENVFHVSSSLSIVALFSALWIGSQGFLGLTLTLNSIFEIPSNDKIDFFKKIPFFDRIFSVFYTIAFLVVMASLLIFNIFTNEIISLIQNISEQFGTPLLKDLSDGLIFMMSLILPFLLSIGVFMFFYKFSSIFYKHHYMPFDALFIGSLVVTIAIFLLSLFYKISNALFSSGGNPVYGSLGSVMVAFVWLMTVCQCIVLGGVFIKTYIDVVKHKKTYTQLLLEPLAKQQR
ncbi:YihY/virulence factor BrkB family protein [Carnobacteriaceae bacterium zg-ZUI252]|nr:YihY/virulence factor BrkB family protein [Carnobacteriaceae bacterium zg-ZUI252]MBS4770191.1 YihY/virulence factor BrkB family protein [Carnobacteriaceae bacterium zg-ZUI240]QTU82783.1 YihY/virulence factor BrkB family protein [Carnobacteriaceae bacterium zg-C25]